MTFWAVGLPLVVTTTLCSQVRTIFRMRPERKMVGVDALAIVAFEMANKHRPRVAALEEEE
jgi:hypothetical protein